jgi:acetoin utilization deacetylase AcuC-like enzyme
MGFCLVNNVAVATAALTSQGERVLIVDWDVHHGNGTQEIFWDDPSVAYVSTHQWPLYPGGGGANEIGGSGAVGLTVNIPLPPGATGDVVRRALDEVAAPVVDGFSPTWVLVSAGFDAHRADPLANLSLSSGDFAELARWASQQVAIPGRLALFLEGGYDLEALRASVRAVLGTLVDVAVTAEPRTSGGPGMEAVSEAGGRRAAALRHESRP